MLYRAGERAGEYLKDLRETHSGVGTGWDHRMKGAAGQHTFLQFEAQQPQRTLEGPDLGLIQHHRGRARELQQIAGLEIGKHRLLTTAEVKALYSEPTPRSGKR